MDNKPKHIVFVIGNYKNGGVAQRATNLANEFAKKGHYCTILSLKSVSEKIFFKLNKGVKLLSISDYYEEHSKDSIYISYLNASKYKIRLLKLLRRVTLGFPNKDDLLRRKIRSIRQGNTLACFVVNNKDAVYIGFGIGYFIPAFDPVSRSNGKLFFAERNASELEFSKEKSEAEYCLSLVKKGAGAILQTRDECSFFGKYLPRNHAVIQNPVKADLPLPFNGERRKAVVNFCRVSEQKNLYLLIDAFAKFHKKNPEYVLEIYGNTVEECEVVLKEKLIEYIASIGKAECIKILPPCSDVHEKVRDATMFVSSSDFEGLSNSMLEALAIGLPTICTDCLGGGAREVIKHGENGLLVPMKDVDALCDTMHKMANDMELSKKCSINAAKVRETNRVDIIAEKWLEVLENDN